MISGFMLGSGTAGLTTARIPDMLVAVLIWTLLLALNSQHAVRKGRPMHLDMWDYLTFATFFVPAVGFIAAFVLVIQHTIQLTPGLPQPTPVTQVCVKPNFDIGADTRHRRRHDIGADRGSSQEWAGLTDPC